MAERIGISNIDFMVRRTVEQAPKATFLREFVKNAEEAAAQAPEGSREVRIYPILMAGTRKLAVWNTGPGMSQSELDRAMDLSSSLGKEMGLQENFGIGAKVSGLAVSPFGIRYRSCKAGEVAELLIRWDEASGAYVREHTESHTTPDHPREHDWTEVVLLGESAEHDTVSFPLGPDVKTTRSHVPTEIFRRFASFLPGVEVRIDTAMTKGGRKDASGRSRTLKTLEDVLDAHGFKHDRVPLPSGATAHFIHDPKNPKTGHTLSSDKNPATGSTSFVALVHRGERYGFKTGRAWSAAAPAFGIGFGSTVLSVEVELPDGMALPTPYRDALLRPSDRSTLLPEHFAAEVASALPGWVRAIVEEHSPSGLGDMSDVQAAMQSILDGFTGRLPASRRAVPAKPRTTAPVAKPSRLSRLLQLVGLTPRSKAPAPRLPSAPRDPLTPLGDAPELVVLTDRAAVKDKGLEGRGARYYPDSRQLFVNGLYPAAERHADEILGELTGETDSEHLRALSLQAARRTLAFRVGKATCYAIAKRLRRDWDEEALTRATSPEALSLAADDTGQSRREAKRLVRDMLKMEGALA